MRIKNTLPQPIVGVLDGIEDIRLNRTRKGYFTFDVVFNTRTNMGNQFSYKTEVILNTDELISDTRDRKINTIIE